MATAAPTVPSPRAQARRTRCEGGPHLAVVSRGREDLFRTLQDEFAREPVQVMWDRRQAERRTHPKPVEIEHRRAQRRGPPPATWAALGVVFVVRKEATSD